MLLLSSSDVLDNAMRAASMGEMFNLRAISSGDITGICFDRYLSANVVLPAPFGPATIHNLGNDIPREIVFCPFRERHFDLCSVRVFFNKSRNFCRVHHG